MLGDKPISSDRPRIIESHKAVQRYLRLTATHHHQRGWLGNATHTPSSTSILSTGRAGPGRLGTTYTTALRCMCRAPSEHCMRRKGDCFASVTTTLSHLSLHGAHAQSQRLKPCANSCPLKVLPSLVYFDQVSVEKLFYLKKL